MNIAHNSLSAILDLGHGSDNRHHIALRVAIYLSIGTDARALSNKANVALGEVLGGWRPAANHLANGGEPITSVIGVEQHEHGTIAIRHALELFEGTIARGTHLALKLTARLADIAGVTVSKASTHRPPPFVYGA